MRKNKIFAAIAVAIMVAPAALNSLPTNNVKADTVGTAIKLTPTYDANGEAAGSRALAAGSKWKLGKKITVDNIEYYQVATNTYVAASDLTDITDTTATTTTTTDDASKNVGKTMTVKTTTTLVDNNAAAINATLPAGSNWKVGKTMTVNGISYYQVATNEWVKASDMTDEATTTTTTTTTTTNNTYKTPMPGDGLVATLTKAQRVYNPETNSYGSTLPVGSAWKINKLVVNKYGSFWGQVATNQYVWITDTTLNSGLNLKDNSEYVADFATHINK